MFNPVIHGADRLHRVAPGGKPPDRLELQIEQFADKRVAASGHPFLWTYVAFRHPFQDRFQQLDRGPRRGGLLRLEIMADQRDQNLLLAFIFQVEIARGKRFFPDRYPEIAANPVLPADELPGPFSPARDGHPAVLFDTRFFWDAYSSPP